jgi:hypothetical protein
MRIRTDAVDNPLELQKYEAEPHGINRGRESTFKHCKLTYPKPWGFSCFFSNVMFE